MDKIMTEKQTVDLFEKVYGQKPEVFARAPGRLEILGNHTDYNEGVVLSAAVNQSTELALKPVKGKKCRLFSNLQKGDKPVEFNLDEIDKAQKGDWTNYVKGVICEIRKRGKDIGAFDAVVTSTVPLSAGMSSSAALEVSACFAFSKAFGIEFSNPDWARIGQGSENNYIGIKSGLLDQFSSIFGKKDSLIYCDFRTVEVIRNVKLHAGYVLVVANSMIKHDLVDSDYNVRRQSCEKAVAAIRKNHPKVKALRDVSLELLEKEKNNMDRIDYLRALHVVGENTRVVEGVKALDEGDVARFGKLLYESHESSRRNFENSCPELDYLVELSKSIPGCIGARLSGGGFGGISIHLVEENQAEKYCERIKSAFKLKTGKETETIICGIGDGAAAKKI